MPILYTAQDVAHFCEVDLKTVHHWVERGKIAHFRTAGRHLRFRRNDVVKLLRAHGYPLPEALVREKPHVALGAPLDDVAKKLASKFVVARFPTALVAIAHVARDQFDALVATADDATIGPAWVAAVRAAAPWMVVTTIGRVDGADVVVEETSKLASELARALAVA